MSVRWGEMMRRAAMFGVEPAAFWRLSLREWRWLTGGDEMSAMTGAELERLAEAWPDEQCSRRPVRSEAKSREPGAGGEVELGPRIDPEGRPG